MLRAQLSDWQKFRAFQGRVRRYYRQRPFNEIVDKVCERQRRHKVGGDVHLQVDVEQQGRLEKWMEFQDYHLQLHDGLEKKRDELKKKLDDARKEAESTGTPGFDRLCYYMQTGSCKMRSRKADWGRTPYTLEQGQCDMSLYKFWRFLVLLTSSSSLQWRGTIED